MPRSRGSGRFPAAGAALVAVLVLVSCGGDRSGSPSGVTEEPVLRNGAAWSGVQGEPRATAGRAFWEHWGDGRAELSSYRLTTDRYGEPRRGEVVLVYVTEPHDRRTWIKDDDVEEPHRVNVMKLNVSRKFLTGIYPYSAMTSVFSPVDDWGGARFRPVKVSASVQEWCGNHHQLLWPGVGALRTLRLSYFAAEGESTRQMEVSRETLYEDALLIQLRELDGPFVGGGSWEGPIVPSLWNARRGHRDVEPIQGRIERSPDRMEDGTEVTRFTLRYGEEYRRTYLVERAGPRRVLGWSTSLGDTVRLVATRRLPYWRLNGTDGARHRLDLGLDSAASGRPPSEPPEGG